MSGSYDGDEPSDIELGMISRDMTKLKAFRHAARDMTRQIQASTSKGLCNDFTKIHVRRFLFFRVAVNEPARLQAIEAAQKAVNQVVKGTSNAFLNNLTHVAQFGLTDFEGEFVCAKNLIASLHKSITPSFAADVARSGMATAINECTAAMIDAVIEDDEDEMPISYDGLSGTEQRALYAAFIHAAHKVMQICNRAAQPSDERIFKHLEKLNTAAP